MSFTVTHTFVSAKVNSDDSSLVSSNAWNANHTLTGTLTLLSPVTYRAAQVQMLTEGETGILNFSSAGTNCATPVLYDDLSGNGSLYGVAAFASGNQVQDHFPIPIDWDGGTISLTILWRSPNNSGSVIWQCQCGFLENGSAPNLSFLSTASLTTNLSLTPYTTIQSTITPLIITGIEAGNEFFFVFSRSDSDSASSPAELISLTFNLNRAVVL